MSHICAKIWIAIFRDEPDLMEVVWYIQGGLANVCSFCLLVRSEG